MKAKDIRSWLDIFAGDDGEVRIDGATLVLEGCNHPYPLDVGLQPDYDREWRTKEQPREQ